MAVGGRHVRWGMKGMTRGCEEMHTHFNIRVEALISNVFLSVPKDIGIESDSGSCR